MTERPLRTTDLAKAIGVHPNTVRLYEEWGFMPPVPRAPNGYRQFRQEHLDCLRLARLALQWPYPGGKDPVLEMVRRAVAGDLGGARESAQTYLDHIGRERALAESAVDVLERWAQGNPDDDAVGHPLRIKDAAHLLDLTPDALRSWERNGLLSVPRAPANRYRLYGAAEIGRLRVIRLLRQAGYSTMAILRLMQHLDEGRTEGLREVLDTPRPDEDVFSAADRWLSALAEQAARARASIAQLEAMQEARRS
jgi:DNA-binding transcriptional MerR regulator